MFTFRISEYKFFYEFRGGGPEGAWAPAPLQFFFQNTLLWRPAQSNY